MLGDALLVKPVTRALADGGERTEVLLPDGRWFDLFSLVCYHGGRTISISTPLDRFPVLVRAGSILPVAEGAQCAADLPVPAREFLVFGGADGRMELYDDAGDGYGYECGQYLLKNFEYDSDNDCINENIVNNGYESKIKVTHINLI